MEILDFTPIAELEDDFRAVSTIDNPDAHPYVNACAIDIARVALSTIRPTQLYVYNPALAMQKKLREQLGELGVNTLEMDGRYEFLDDENKRQIIIPPIVERNQDSENILVDGMHRSFLAKNLGIATINAILIDGVDENIPPFGEPIDWSEVRQYDSLNGVQKRRSKFPHGDKGKYYRDLSKITSRKSNHRDDK